MAHHHEVPRDPAATPAGAGSSAATPADRVRRLIAEGRGMRALQMAKDLAKAQPGEESTDLLVQATRARIAELAAAGMLKEARDLLAHARARYAGRADWGALDQMIRHETGDFDGVLRQWADPSTTAPERERLAAQLRRGVRDLGKIAESKVLPAEDPLRLAARALQAAFVAAADGRLSSDARQALRVVSHRSPLAPWRSFILALAAFHEGDEEAMGRALTTIPEDAAVQALVPVLRALQRGEPPDPELGSLARRVFERVLPRSRELALVSDLRRAQEGRDGRAFATALRSLLSPLELASPRAAKRLVRWILYHVLRNQLPAGKGADVLPAAMELSDRESHRLYALASDDPEESCLAWCYWLQVDTRRLRRLEDRELALVLDRLAGIVAEAHEAALDVVFDGEVSEDDLDAESLAARALVMDGRLDEFEEESLVLVLRTAQLLSLLRDRSPAIGDPFRPALWLGEHALALDPRPERFRALLAHAAATLPRREAEKHRAAIYERWHLQRPTDLEPVLALLEADVARGAHQRALRRLEAAEAIDPLHEGVRTARFRVLLLGLHSHLRQSKPKLAEADLAALEATPVARTPERRAYLQAARLRVAQLRGDAPGEATARASLEALVGSAEAAEEALTVLQAASAGFPRQVALRGRSTEERYASLARILRLVEAIGHRAAPGVPAPLPPSELRRIDLLPPGADDLARICDHACWSEDRDLLHVASGAGLRHGGREVGRFLTYRWLALQGTRADTEEVRQAAHHFASRFQDAVSLRRLRAGRWFIDRPYEQTGYANPDAVLARERQITGTLGERFRKPERMPEHGPEQPAAGKPRRRRRQRRTQQLLLPFDPPELDA